MHLVTYSKRISAPDDSVTYEQNTVLVDGEGKGKLLLEQWNENVRNNARNYNRTNNIRFDFVSSRPATEDEIKTMDFYEPLTYRY